MQQDLVKQGSQDIKIIWNAVLETLENSGLNNAAINSWIHPLKPYKIDGNIFILSTENNYVISTVERRYLKHITPALKRVTGNDYEVSIVLESDLRTGYSSKDKPSSESNYYKSNLRKKYIFETFVKGKSNEFAFAAALAVAEAPGRTSYNPLFLHGDVGLGKTHLMHAIGNYILDEDPESEVLYTTSENLTNEFINSIRDHKNQEFRDKYREIDVLLVDDIQFLSEKEGTQEEFFHTFNTLYNNNKQIVITSDKPPHELKTIEKRLSTRFGSGLTVDVTMPDFETRAAILEKKVELDNIKVPDNVLRFIAKNISSNIRELEGALNKVTAYSKLTNTEISLELAEKALKDVISEGEKANISVELIQEIVAKYYNITADDIRSKKRTAIISHPRHVAMYLSRMMLDKSLMFVGKSFGGRDHSTVVHACDKISAEMETSDELKNDLFRLEKEINALTK